MQSGNPFRTNENAQGAGFASTYYAPPQGPPPVTDSKDSEQMSAPGHSNMQRSPDYPPPGLAMQPQWPATQPPPSYSVHPTPAVPHMHTLPSLPQNYPPRPEQTSSAASSPGPSQPSSRSLFDMGNSNVKKRNPLDPPPQSFLRPIPPHLSHAPNTPGYPGGGFPQIASFPPMSLYSKGDTLDGGFPILLPPCALQQPHPFTQRDVVEADWVRFLEDLQITGRLTGGQRVTAGVLPMAMSVGFVGGMFISRAIEKRMKSKKTEPVGELVDTWNNHFFHGRRLHVILARGPENISGDVDGPAPDWRGGRSRPSSRSSSSSSSDDSDCKHGRHHNSRRAERREDRRERKRERREDRRAHRDTRREMKHEKYRLVILSV